MGFFDVEELDGEAVGSVSEVLESIAADLGQRGRVAITPHEIVRGFLESTPTLTFGEQAQLLGGMIEDQRASGSRASSPSSSSSRTTSRPSGPTSSGASSRPSTSSGASSRPSTSSGASSRPPTSSGASSRPPTSSRPSTSSGSSRPSSSGSSFDIGRITRGITNTFRDVASYVPQVASLVQQGASLAQQGAQAIQQFQSPPPSSAPLEPPPPSAAPEPAPTPTAPAPAPTATAAPQPAPSFAPGAGAAAPNVAAPGFAPATPLAAVDGSGAPAAISSPVGYAPYSPPTGYPPPGYPPPGYPPPGYPPIGYSPTGYPPTGYPPTGYPPTGYPPFASGALGQTQTGVDPLGAMWQALRQRQIPPLPGQLAFGTPGQLAMPPIAAVPGARPPADATALLRMLLGLPQLQTALQSAAVLGPAGSRTMELPIPTSTAGGVRSVQVPLGAMMNAIAALAGRSMEELNASTQESDPEIPEYLVDEDGEFIVDPTNAAERAALLTHMVRLNQAAARAGWFVEAREPDEGLDDTEAWARDAGFERWERP